MLRGRRRRPASDAACPRWQALASSPTIQERVQQELVVRPPDTLGAMVGAMLLKLAEHREGQPPLNPTHLVREIKECHKSLGHGAQEDAEEAFLVLLAAVFSSAGTLGASGALRSTNRGPRAGAAGATATAVQTLSGSTAAKHSNAECKSEAGLAALAELELSAKHHAAHRSLALPPPLEDPVFAERTFLHASMPPSMLRRGGDGDGGGRAGEEERRPDLGIWLPAHGCSAGKGLAVLHPRASGWGRVERHPVRPL